MVTIIKFFSLAVLFAVYLIMIFLIIGLTGVALIKVFKWLCDLKDKGEQ